MKDPQLDWGQLIAYLIPGFVAIGCVALCEDNMFSFMGVVLYHGESAGAIIACLMFALAAGMVISVLRAASIDRTFALQPRWLYRNTMVIPTPREDPNLTEIAAAGLLDVYREARAEDKRPYQFYGNLLVSFILLAMAWPLGIQRGHTLSPNAVATTLYLVLFATVIPLLYFASRRSHFRYMTEIHRLNERARLRMTTATPPVV